MKSINVLSLFDGISCGQIALERAGIPVNNYYASEIDKNAIKVTMNNYPNTIQLGDVTKWREWDLPKIDILIGGSPCQGFSRSGDLLNFDDPRSKLFFEYVEILNHLKKQNPNIKFLLENVKMKKEWFDIISKHLKVNPLIINSNLVSAQNRERMYWVNWEIGKIESKQINLNSILEDDSIALTEKANCITSSGREGLTVKGYQHHLEKKKDNFVICSKENKFKSVNVNGVNYRKLTVLEHERLQTVPDNYTKHVSDNQRLKILGNGWTVDIISHIFSFMNNE